MKPKITFVHLFNDYSGSPLILSTVISGMYKKGYDCEIITCRNSEGFLSNIENVSYDFFQYRWHSNQYIRLALYIWSQIALFLKIFKNRKHKSIIYINTLLPFGAALAGWILNKKVIYHIHEVSIKPRLLKQFLKWAASRFSSQNIFVSDFLQEAGNLPRVESATIYNALSENFIEDAELQQLIYDKPKKPFTVLMLCSLKDYKGVKEFVKLAEKLVNLQFELVINSDKKSIDEYFDTLVIPANLNIYPSQTNVHPFYHKSHLVVNLSHPEQWIETFGMTLLEGMYYGLPCIAPPVGGPVEIIDNKKDGFLIDQRNLRKIVSCIKRLHQNPDLYNYISENAREKVARFRSDKMIDEIYDLM